MVATSRERLTEAGLDPAAVRWEDGTGDPYRPDPASATTVSVADRDEVPTR